MKVNCILSKYFYFLYSTLLLNFSFDSKNENQLLIWTKSSPKLNWKKTSKFFRRTKISVKQQRGSHESSQAKNLIPQAIADFELKLTSIIFKHSKSFNHLQRIVLFVEHFASLFWEKRRFYYEENRWKVWWEYYRPKHSKTVSW